MNQVRTQRMAEDFSDGVCRLLLPSGHYQDVDIRRPHHLYRTFVFLIFRQLIEVVVIQGVWQFYFSGRALVSISEVIQH